LRRPGIALKDLQPLLRKCGQWPSSSEAEQPAEIEIRYEGYIQQQVRDAEKLRHMSARCIPLDFDYWKVDGLNREIKEKLSKVRPRDLAMAGRIPGITPAAIAILSIQIGSRRSENRVRPGTRRPPA
jgi:tRNA uridine 5-carboxymethylaminomethyl modification enzyme